MNLKTLRTELLQERVHDELRRKWLIDLVDNIVETLPDLIDWNLMRRHVLRWKDNPHAISLECLRTKKLRLPIKPDGSQIEKDEQSSVEIVFQPHWGGEKTPEKASLSPEDWGGHVVFTIILPVNSSWIGMEESYEKQKEKTKITKAPVGSIWMEGFNNFLFSSKRVEMTKKIGPKVRDLLFHEIIHLMDHVEYAESKMEKMEKMHLGYKSPSNGTATKFKDYFNHNLEYNAYYLATLTQTLENFDKRKLSKGIIDTYSQKQFIEACLNQFQIINSSYIHNMSNATKRKIIQRLGRWYNDVLLPEYRAKGKTSFATNPELIKPRKEKKPTEPTVEENVLNELESVWP